jgi:hypothetical protein
MNLKDGQYVREVAPGDLPALVELCREHAEFERAEFDPTGKVELLRELLFGEPARLHAFLLFDAADALIGYVTFSLETSTWSGTFIHVDCLYLRKQARAHGGAIHLIGAGAVKVMAMVGAGLTAQWQTPPWNERAIGYYESLGARRVDKARFYIDADRVTAIAAWYGSLASRGSERAA